MSLVVDMFHRSWIASLVVVYFDIILQYLENLTISTEATIL